MIAPQEASIETWTQALCSIGINVDDITAGLVMLLSEHDLSPSTLSSESFCGSYKGRSESEAGINVAKQLAGLHGMQAFLETAIDWKKAWENLRDHEGYVLACVSDGSWLLFAKDR
jgi:hypothetical protein